MIEWPIYRNFSVFSQNSGYFDQNEKGVKKCPFPQSLRFCHNWWASGGVPGVRYAEKLSALFYLHWESLWPGVELDQLLTVVLEDQNQLNKNVSDLKIICSKMATLEAERNQFAQRNPQSNESRYPKVQLNLNDQDPKPTREVKIEPHSNIKEKIELAECDIDAKNELLKEALLNFDAIMQSDFEEMKTKDEKMTIIKSLREKLAVDIDDNM